MKLLKSIVNEGFHVTDISHEDGYVMALVRSEKNAEKEGYTGVNVLVHDDGKVEFVPGDKLSATEGKENRKSIINAVKQEFGLHADLKDKVIKEEELDEAKATSGEQKVYNAITKVVNRIVKDADAYFGDAGELAKKFGSQLKSATLEGEKEFSKVWHKWAGNEPDFFDNFADMLFQELGAHGPTHKTPDTYETIFKKVGFLEEVQIDEKVSIPSVDLHDLVQLGALLDNLSLRIDAAKKALSLTHKLKDPADRKRHFSAIFSNLNSLRSALKRGLNRYMDLVG